MAAGDLRISAGATYELVPEAGRLDVSVAFTLTNLKPDTVTETVVTQYYFDRFSVQIPRDASDVVVIDGRGVALTTSEQIVETESGSTARVLSITLPARIYYEESQSFVLRFVLAGGEPRSESGIRANPAYAAFRVRAWGDPGRSDVDVIIPSDFEVDHSGSAVATRIAEGGEQSWYQEDITDPESFSVFFAARRDSALVTSTVDAGDLTVSVSAWPGDELWSERVSQVVATGFPELQAAVGLGVGDQHQLAIIEALDPTLLGYAGWYLASDELIELGEGLDDHVVLHEMSHLWFNGGLFDARWINEGLADTYASAAVEAIGGRADEDRRVPNLPDLAASFAVPLHEWSFPSTAPAEDRTIADREAFGYNAAFFVIDSIVDDIGEEAMREVLAAAAQDLIAYRSGSSVETVDPRDDWRRLLDLVEEVGGSGEADRLFRRYVVPVAEIATLDDRAAARTAYAELVVRDGEWDTPFAVRSSMASWDFDEALASIELAGDVVDLSQDISVVVAGVGLVPPPDLETAYEESIVTDDLVAAIALGSEQLDVANVLVAARGDVDESRSLVASIGLWGRDPEVEWRQAADAFEVADLPGTLLESAEVVSLLDDASRVGRMRLIWSALYLVVALALATVVVVVLRRRRRFAWSHDQVEDGAAAFPADHLA